MAIKRLSLPGMGLPPFLCHRLASSLLFPILGYGGDVFTPTVHMIKLSSVSHKIQRWCMNCFTCTPTDILAIEACLPPLDLLFAYKKCLANSRILCFPPEINPATARLPPSVQTPSLHGHAPDYRVHLRSNAGSRLLLPSLPPRPPSKKRAHLPLHAVPHSLLFSLGPDGLASLLVTPQHLLCETCPAPAPGHSYPQLKRHSCDLLIKEWQAMSLDSTTYPYRPSLEPHPFMGLNKFDAETLHQMRSGKGYLRAHSPWNDDHPKTCPRCNKAPKTLVYAVLSCPAREPARTRHLQGVSDLGPDAPVWSSTSLLLALARFVRSTQTAFP